MNNTSKLGLLVGIAAYCSAWFAVVNQDYIYALINGVCAFIIWLVSLEFKGLLND